MSLASQYKERTAKMRFRDGVEWASFMMGFDPKGIGKLDSDDDIEVTFTDGSKVKIGTGKKRYVIVTEPIQH